MDNVLDWLTLFLPDEEAKPPEPIAGGPAGYPSSSSSSTAAPPPYFPQDYFSRNFDDERMVGTQPAETKRQKRARRAQLRDAGFRVFTADVTQAGSFGVNSILSLALVGLCSFAESVVFVLHPIFIGFHEVDMPFVMHAQDEEKINGVRFLRFGILRACVHVVAAGL